MTKEKAQKNEPDTVTNIEMSSENRSLPFSLISSPTTPKAKTIVICMDEWISQVMVTYENLKKSLEKRELFNESLDLLKKLHKQSEIFTIFNKVEIVDSLDEASSCRNRKTAVKATLIDSKKGLDFQCETNAIKRLRCNSEKQKRIQSLKSDDVNQPLSSLGHSKSVSRALLCEKGNENLNVLNNKPPSAEMMSKEYKDIQKIEQHIDDLVKKKWENNQCLESQKKYKLQHPPECLKKSNKPPVISKTAQTILTPKKASSTCDLTQRNPSSVSNLEQINPSSVFDLEQINPSIECDLQICHTNLSSLFDLGRTNLSSVSDLEQINPSSVSDLEEINTSSVSDLEQINPSIECDLQICHRNLSSLFDLGRPNLSSVCDLKQTNLSSVCDLKQTNPLSVHDLEQTNLSPERDLESSDQLEQTNRFPVPSRLDSISKSDLVEKNVSPDSFEQTCSSTNNLDPTIHALSSEMVVNPITEYTRVKRVAGYMVNIVEILTQPKRGNILQNIEKLTNFIDLIGNLNEKLNSGIITIFSEQQELTRTYSYLYKNFALLDFNRLSYLKIKEIDVRVFGQGLLQDLYNLQIKTSLLFRDYNLFRLQYLKNSSKFSSIPFELLLQEKDSCIVGMGKIAAQKICDDFWNEKYLEERHRIINAVRQKLLECVEDFKKYLVTLNIVSKEE